MKTIVPYDYSDRIRRLRSKIGLTQVDFEQKLGVSFASVNRWENGKSKPTPVVWDMIERAERLGDEEGDHIPSHSARLHGEASSVRSSALVTDFSARSEVVRAVVEGQRLGYAHLCNPAFAAEMSLVDPLPHQRIAVYESMLQQSRLRFLLADDAGAGKTIMAGLYMREMLSRRLIRRVLIVPPAGLVGNWKRELETLFSLEFRIITGADARNANPFLGNGSDHIIVSVDTLAGELTFRCLQHPDVEPYDLVIFDEAHKLAANREQDFHVRKTDRYRVAEALAGIHSDIQRWQLTWKSKHLLLLTATPHMGKDFPYYCLWHLLEPESLSTFDAFNSYPPDARAKHFLRRTKEEMVYLDGRPIFPMRISDTLSYDLTQGEISEQKLYDETTEYIQTFYTPMSVMNTAAAQLAKSVFQRRSASSTFALKRSLEKRYGKVTQYVADIKAGKITAKQLASRAKRLRDLFDDQTADEEALNDGREANEVAEDDIISGVIARSVVDLEAEAAKLESLVKLADQVLNRGDESKFAKLREVIQDPEHRDEKLIIFTEHRDTLTYLANRLEGLGFTGQVARLHGGMGYQERQEQVDFFRKPAGRGGATYLVATDAAGEGINLQFCWLMVNYDVPWNPARLEQRMGRIHRYGQKHDPVIILNIVAGKTREGRVIKTLLDKLERIRKELSSDKVFDVVGRVLEGVSIKSYIERALTEEGADSAVREIEERLTEEHVKHVQEEEKGLYGRVGDVEVELPRLREEIERETYRRLMPGYVRRFLETSIPLISAKIYGDPGDVFSIEAVQPKALDPLLPVLEKYPERERSRLTVNKPEPGSDAVFLHIGEPFFDAYREYVCARFAQDALRGAVFTDPTAAEPYLFHLALVTVVRKADPSQKAFSGTQTLEYRLVGLKQTENGEVHECPVEQLLVLKGAYGITPSSARLAASAASMSEAAKAYAFESIARRSAEQRRAALLDSLIEREVFIRRGYDYEYAELANARISVNRRLRDGDSTAAMQLASIKKRQAAIEHYRDEALAVIRREPELIAPGEVTFLAHALVVPTPVSKEIERYDAEIERIAVNVVRAHEEALGARVVDVSTAELAVAAGLNEYPGFDLLSYRPDGSKLCIEVKGRARVGEIELSENEWAKACNHRDDYWLYVVYDCATAYPRLLRVQDPFGKLLVKVIGGVKISETEILGAAEGE
ncbi:MAG: DUF3883 domain-containing protein [Armatimonadetes bacterium]|nr:DUF3883 domain-containing protein [Armatimonadota bacterium]